MKGSRIIMIRHNLDRVPQHALPSGYTIRWHRTGDKAAWLRIHELAEHDVPTSPEIYDQQFAAEEQALGQRQAFLLDAAGREIGTASAWFNEDYHGQRFGRLHWVAIVPEHQGKGLAKPFMTVICNRLIELGHDRAYLTTWTAKLPAINLYFSFGFEPDIRTEEDGRLWQEILPGLKPR
jgi:GNAT superfamily N-acetyltransferase